MNPLCACGCGQEVARPTNKWVFGHLRPKRLTEEAKKKAMRWRKAGKSTYWISKQLGVSQPAICNLTWHIAHPDFAVYSAPVHNKEHQAQTILRQSDIDKEKLKHKENREWQTAKRTHKQLKSYLNRNRLQSRTAA